MIKPALWWQVHIDPALYTIYSHHLIATTLSLTRIESRPAHQGTWEYVFFIDVEGHINDPLMQGAQCKN